jgi:zinc-ribbon domain
MAEEVNFDGQTADLDVFDCPKCGETIDTSATVCRFCGAKIDHAAAENSAHLLARVDVACSDASYLRNAVAIVLILVGGVVFALLRQPRFFILFGFQNTVLGFCLLMLLVSSPFPLWTFRWWRKYARITSQDDDFQNARKVIKSIGTGAAAALLTFGSLFCLVLLFRFAHA